MTDTISPELRHYVMSQVHSSDTKPELRLRRALWRMGFRYHVNDKRLPGKPDIVLPRYKTVIFVHGCFWHGHMNCGNYRIPKTNVEFWTKKVSRNQERDQEVWRKLEAKGWSVIIVWECELEKARQGETVIRVANEINANGELYNQRQKERKEELLMRRNERAVEKTIFEKHMSEVRHLSKQSTNK